MNLFFHSIPTWLDLISLAYCIGTLVCLLWVLPITADTDIPRHEDLLSRMWFLFGVAISALVMSSVAGLLVRSAEMSGFPLQRVFPALPTVIFRTHFGHVWLIRIAALMLMAITVKAGRRHRNTEGFLYAMLGAGLIIAMTESASGHASDAGDFSVAEIMDCLHLLAASVWGGGLFVLSMAILSKIVKPGDHSAWLIADVAGRFSKIAGLAVGIIVLTALYNEWVYVGSFEALLKTPYGRTVIVKIFLFFLLLNLGGFNRYISVPLLQEWAGISPDNRGIIHRIAAQFRTRFLGSPKGDRIALRFMHSVRVEAFLMIAVMLCAASLRHEIPARHLSHMEHHGEKMHSMGHNNGDNPHTH